MPLTFCDVSASVLVALVLVALFVVSAGFNVTHVRNLCVCVEGHRLNLQ